MPKPASFIRKVVEHFDRIDRATLQNYVLELAEENCLYEQVLQYSNEGIVLVNALGRIRFINRQAADWLEIDPKKGMNARLTDLISDSALLRFFEEHLPDLKDKVVGNFQILTPRELQLRLFLAAFDEFKEKIILVLMTQISAEQAPALKKVVSSEALLSLALGIAHEIGNPLNSIGIQLQLLKKEMKSASLKTRPVFEKTLNTIQAETMRLDRIVRNFLKAARRPPLRFKTDDLNQVLEEAIRFVEPELSAQGIRVDFKPDMALPSFLLDRERLRQAFINLIKNALEAMPQAGSISIQITHKSKLAVIQFTDEGAGIEESNLPHIFEAYFTTKKEGSGLGLMAVLNAVQEHGGRIEVRSKAGKGTTFILLLPIRQPKLQLPQYKTR